MKYKWQCKKCGDDYFYSSGSYDDGESSTDKAWCYGEFDFDGKFQFDYSQGEIEAFGDHHRPSENLFKVYYEHSEIVCDGCLAMESQEFIPLDDETELVWIQRNAKKAGQLDMFKLVHA